jgi:DNA transposition AAA+ family ATPase
MNLKKELPNDADLVTVQDEMLDYIKEAKVTKSSVAKKIGINEGRFNAFLYGKYEGDNETVRKKCIEFLNMKLRRLELKKVEFDYYDTENSLNVKAVCKMTQLYKTMGLLYGDAGIGKSLTIEEFSRENINVYLITVYHSITALDLMESILTELKVDAKGLDGTKMAEIIKVLKGTDNTLIIDEAQHLSLKCLEKIRAIHDKTGVGIVFASSPDLYQRLTGAKRKQYEQIFSRMLVRREIRAVVTKKDVEGILRSTDFEFDDKMVNFCYGIARKSGHYRTLRHIIQHSSYLSKQAGRPLDLNILRQAESMIFSVSVTK